MIQKRIPILLGLAFLLSLGGCGAEDPTLLTVGEQKIPLSEFQRSFDDILKQDEGFTADSASARRFLTRYIDKTLIEQAATDSLVWNPILEDRARDILESKMMRIMREDSYRHVLDIPDDELRQIFERARMRYRYRQMYFQTQAEAQAVFQTLKEGARFSAVADHYGFPNGGETDWRTILDVPVEVVDLLDKLGPGEVGGPVRTGGLTYVVQFLEKEPTPGQLPSFEQAAHVLRLSVQQQRAGNLMTDFDEKLLKDHKYMVYPAEVAWMTQFLRDATRGVSRAAPTADGPQKDPIPWTECPLPREEWNRMIASCDVDTASAILILDHLLTKLLMDWPTFEKEQDVTNLTRELLLDRIMRAECWRRGYDKRPDLAWQDRKQRSFMLARNFYQEYVWKRVRPSVEEARSWYTAHAGEFGEPEKRRFVQLSVRDWGSAIKAREALAGNPDRNSAMAAILRFDRTAAWVDGGAGEFVTGPPQNALQRQLLRLSPGEVSEPIPDQGRFLVARLESVVPAHVPVFETVAEQVVGKLTEVRADSLFKEFVRDRRASTKVVVNEDAFAKLRFTPPPEKPAEQETAD
ncbi:MAG: peptidyl-prolyl cis-trans isomerase [Candidatus Eisenbacteria bacterium]|nr:peptidyl-prolyl cis-trans isomerase [Candidatus Eisenbacteria bacterium]